VLEGECILWICPFNGYLMAKCGPLEEAGVAGVAGEPLSGVPPL